MELSFGEEQKLGISFQVFRFGKLNWANDFLLEIFTFGL